MIDWLAQRLREGLVTTDNWPGSLVNADPVHQQLSQMFDLAQRDFEFYDDKLRGLVGAYRGSVQRFERQDLLRRVTKALVDSDNTREDVCHLLVLAVDAAARR